MDEKFYEELKQKNERSPMSDEDLDALVDIHLDKVDHFRKKFDRALSRKRRERKVQNVEIYIYKVYS